MAVGWCVVGRYGLMPSVCSLYLLSLCAVSRASRHWFSPSVSHQRGPVIRLSFVYPVISCLIIIIIIPTHFGCCSVIQLCFVAGEFFCRQPTGRWPIEFSFLFSLTLSSLGIIDTEGLKIIIIIIIIVKWPGCSCFWLCRPSSHQGAPWTDTIRWQTPWWPHHGPMERRQAAHLGRDCCLLLGWLVRWCFSQGCRLGNRTGGSS